VARELVIWGAKGHAKVLLDFLGPPEYELVALFDNDAQVVSPVEGVLVLHGAKGLERWRREHPTHAAAALVAVGGPRGGDRVALGRLLQDAGCELIRAVHPTAHVARGARLGSAVQVLAQASVGADATLGEACIINTAASVDHECVLGDGVHVAPGATLAGCVTLGTSAFVGAAAVILPHIRVGDRAVVGAGAVVTRDLPSGVVAVGTPARILREIDERDRIEVPPR
jgi:sugar O-acyltransferase (sialic acid O-acetyltransferase NeuD family)